MLVGHRPPGDRDRAVEHYRELFASGELDPAGLFVARSQGPIRGAMMVHVMPGALGLAWPPAVERGRNRTAMEDALIAAAGAWLRSQGVKICQAFARDSERESCAPLERGGFIHLTQLVELRHDLQAIPDASPQFTVESFGEANREAFLSALLASFEGSLDCPEVSGSRTDAELLAAYTDSMQPDAPWFLAQLDGQAVGVLLLDADSEPDACELTYLGIAPGFRRRGLGSELVRFALHWARNAGRGALALSVDARNLPARRLYETLGFQASGARSVFLADWSDIS